MLTIDVHGLDVARARLFDREARIVGWGTGSVFDYFHGLFPVRLDYLVDNDVSRRGERRRGFGIARPERLASEDPSRTCVIIYSSAWPEIREQIRSIGPFLALPASAIFAGASARARLAWAESIAARPQAPRRPRAYNSIVVQGPVLAGVTAHVLRLTQTLHPGDLVLLSTWDDTDPALLAEAGAVADDVVVSRRPSVCGVQNRNAQIVSTRAGIERAMTLGAKTILKTRSDLAVLADSVFGRSRWWLDSIDRKAPREAGLRDRLIVPSSFTRKFLLYHPSDLVMLGAAEDLARYWSAPLDPREGQLMSPEALDRPIAEVNMDGHPAESYLGLQFNRVLGRPAPGTVRDSWAFYRDLFAVVDNDWFEMLWFKNLSIPDATLRSGVRQMVSQLFWQRLNAGDQSVERELADVDPAQIALRALAGAA